MPRVATVQLHFAPAARLDRVDWLEEPAAMRSEKPLLRDSGGEAEDVRALQQRVRAAHVVWIGRRAEAVLRWCATLGVQLVVFPE